MRENGGHGMAEHDEAPARATETQRATRHKLFEPVVMRIDNVSVRGHLLDLSRSGALAHTEEAPQIGARVQIEGIGVLTPCRVVWVREKRFGLHFDQMLPQAVVDRLIEL